MYLIYIRFIEQGTLHLKSSINKNVPKSPANNFPLYYMDTLCIRGTSRYHFFLLITPPPTLWMHGPSTRCLYLTWKVGQVSVTSCSEVLGTSLFVDCLIKLCHVKKSMCFFGWRISWQSIHFFSFIVYY